MPFSQKGEEFIQLFDSTICVLNGLLSGVEELDQSAGVFE